MKQLNFLSKSGSQSGSHRVVTLASTVGSPSVHRRGTMLKLISVLVLILTIGIGNAWGASATWALLTSEPSDWSGEYLIVYNSGCFDGHLTTGFDQHTKVDVTITNNKITLDDQYALIIAKSGTKYSMQTASGYYIGRNTNSNGMDASSTWSTNYTVSFGSWNSTDKTVKISGNGGRALGRNGNVWRFYASSNAYTNLSLYKKLTLSSIAVKTAPTKVDYTEGENFDPAGLVLTLTYSDNSTEDVTYNNSTKGNFTFSPTLTTSLQTSHASVTITYGGKTTSQAITVAASGCTNSITINKGSESHGTFTLDKDGSQATCSGLTVVVTPDAADHYHVGSVSATTGETGSDNGDGTWTITYAENSTGSSTINVVFAEDNKYTLNYHDGSGDGTKNNVYEGTNLISALGTPAASCDQTSTAFVGWTTTEIATKTDTKPTLVAANAVVNSTTAAEKYYAVYAKNNTGSWSITSIDQLTSGSGYATYNGSHTASGTTYTSNQVMQNSGIQFQSSTGYIYNTTAMAYDITSIVIESSSTNWSVYTNGSAISSTPASGAIAISSSNNTRTFTVSSTGHKYFHIKGGASTPKATSITVNYGTYKDYITTCCNELGSINGSVSLSQKSATLSWDLTGAQNGGKDHINSWKVEYKLSSDDDWTVAESTLAKATLTKTISDLNCNTDYDFRVSANVQSGYCDIVKEWTSQKTTKFTITKDETGGGGITLSPTATSVCDGDVIDVIANTPDGSHEGTGTIKVVETGSDPENDVTSTVYNSGTGKLTMPAYNITITATYAEKQTPSVGVSVSALDFESPKKGASVAAKTFSLTGSALVAGTLTLVAPSGYTVSPNSIDVAAGALSAQTITVTPSTENAGAFNGNISISGAGVEETNIVALTMTVLETYTVNWYVNGTKIDANSKTDVEGTEVTAPSDFSAFTDCVPDFHFIGWATSAIEGGSDDEKPTLVTPITAIGTTNVNYYAVFADGTPASVDTLLYEEFDNTTTSDASSEFATSKFPNFNGSLSKAFTSQYGGVKFGTGSAAGYITSKSLDLSEAFTVSLKARYYNTGGDNASIQVTIGSQTKTISYEDLTNDFKSFSLDFDAATSTSTVKIGTDVKRAYIDNVLVSQTIAEDFSMYYTTCPHVSRVTLSAAEVSNGSISFEQSGSAVTNVRTDGGEDVEVDVVPDPATGYELTGVALSGTAASHASYDAGVITIDADAEGALTATATFSQANYTVTMAQTGDADAELSEDQSNKHYNDVITVTAEDKAGYVFKGWTASPAVTFANAKALETTFSMPNGNVTVTAAYEAVHDVAWALENTPSSGSSDSVYVKGIISKKEKLESDNTISYWISDNGQHVTGTVLEVYKGKGVNKVTFSSLDDLNVGDAVVVRGKLKTFSGTKEFDNGNYMYSRTAAAVASVAIGGSAEKTAYSPSDNTFSFAGLTATATYNTGYVKDVTGEATWTANSANPYTVAAGGDVTVRATFGEKYDEEVVTVTYTSKTVKEIYLEYESTYTFKGMDLPKPKVYAKYVEEIDDDEITSLVEAANGYDTESAYNKNTPDNYTIKVEYESFNAEYTVQVRKIFDNEDAPHNVADATELIIASAYQSTTSSTDYMWVRGIVSGFNGTYNNRYYISDDGTASGQLYVFNGTYFNGAAFTADNKLKVGDEVILKATILNYNGATPELTGSQVTYQLRDPAFAFADVVAGDEFEAGFSADMTVVPTSNEGEAEFTLSSGNTDAVTIVAGKLHAVEEGDAVITASRAATDNTGSINYKAKNATFNVHVIAERTRYAITMDKNGGSGVDPVYENQLEGATVDLPANNTYSKANSAFDAWVVTETVSGDAVAVTDGHFTMPAAAVTIQATWNDVETCAISFMVSGSEVATADAPQTAEYTITQTADDVNGYEFVGWAESEENTDVETVLTTISSYTPALNEDSKILYAVFRKSVEGGEVTDEITNADLAATGSAYTEFTNVTISTSAIYAGKTSKSNGIQMNATSPNAIVTTTTGGLLKNISIEWNSNCAADRVLDVYAKNTVYAGSSDLWGAAAAQGTKVTSFTNNGSTTSYDFVADYAYIGVRSNDKALNINKISITWETAITYYTTNPVAKYNIKYRAGEAENVTGLCDADRTWGTITLCDAPTCADKVFAKWSDGTNLYAAGASYTLSADVTFTATWTDKPKYTVTYTANGGTGTAPAVEEYMEGETVEVKENEYFSKPGFVYAGWQVVYNDGTDHIITPDEDGEFEMVAYNVTIKALWEEPSNQKWVRVDATEELASDGTNYIIVASQASAAMGTLNESYYNSVGIVKTGNYLNGPESMTKVTLEEGSEDGKLAMKHGSKYIYSTSAKNIGERDDKFDWTITIADGVATINAGTAGKLQFNTGSPRFTTYTSSQQAVAIYREKALTPIDQNGMTEADVNTYDDVEIGQDKTWTVSGEIEVGDVYMKEGAVIANSAEVTANDLYFKARHGKSNQIFDLSKITVVSNMYYDFQLCDGDVDADYWYSISVPFDVDLNDGVFQVGGTTPLVNHTDFEVWEYDTQKRADTQSNGWKRSSDNMMHAGKAYLIGFNPGQPNIIRLKAAAGWKTNLFSGSSMSVVSTGGSGTHDNWNGLANPTGRYIDVNADAQVFNNNTHQFDPFTYDAQAYNFVVGTAFFVQSASAVTISNENHGQYRAPKRENESKCAYAVRITRDEATSFDNQIIVRASEEATGEYTQGHDMLTMNNATSNTAAMLWTENYGGKRLAIEEAAWLNGTATYVLKMYAPKAGTYSISVAEPKEDADLYLTYEGNIIWNLSTSAYELDLTKGTADGYGLMLVRKAPQIATGVENVQGDKTQCTKVVLNDHVYILRGEKMFDVTGKAVR